MSTVQDHHARPTLRARREFTAALTVGLLVSGAVALGMSRTWVTATAVPQGLPRMTAEVTGGGLAPLAGALALLPLAALGAVLASRGWVRRAVGLISTCFAAVIVLAAAHPGESRSLLERSLAAKGWTAAAPYTTSSTAWRWVVLLGGIGCVVVGALIMWRGPRWPTMGQRYDAVDDRPVAPSAGDVDPPADELDEESLWRALDRGHDPTGGP